MILSPSARNSPSTRRAFLSRSERRRLTVSLEKEVTCRGTHSAVIPDDARISSILAKPVLDQRQDDGESLLGALAGRVDRDRVAHRGAQHHQAHDRGAADPVAVLLDLDGRRQAAGAIDELGACPRVKYAA